MTCKACQYTYLIKVMGPCKGIRIGWKVFRYWWPKKCSTMLFIQSGPRKSSPSSVLHVSLWYSHWSLVCILRRVFEQLVNSRAVTMLRYTGCNTVILMAATAWLMLSFSSCIVRRFDSYTVIFKCPQRKLQIQNWRTTSATQLQPSKSLRYIRYTATWLDVRSCVLMQKATTCNIFYDGISFCIWLLY